HGDAKSTFTTLLSPASVMLNDALHLRRFVKVTQICFPKLTRWSVAPCRRMQANFYAVGPRAYWLEMTRWDGRRKVRYPPSGLQPLQTAVERRGPRSPRTRGRPRQPRRKTA